MSTLFIQAACKNGKYFVNTRTFVTLFLYDFADISPKVTSLKVSVIYEDVDSYSLPVSFDSLTHKIVNELPDLCTPPVIKLNNNYVISGLCSVARQICKLSRNEDIKKLLGFRESCLVACAENSIWTRFCEIEFIDAIDCLVKNRYVKDGLFTMPECVSKYENHLSKPVRIHNIYKIARNEANNQNIKSSTPRDELSVFHDYAEGPYMSLADAILFCCYSIFFRYCPFDILGSNLPLTQRWFHKLAARDRHLRSSFALLAINDIRADYSDIHVPIVADQSLYNADSTKLNATNQTQIESALATVQSLPLGEIKNCVKPFGNMEAFNWDDIPAEINPISGGTLPAKRATRKSQQLETVAKAVIAVASKTKCYKIVDFCSGSGHVGILIAYLLPHSQIILVENKERSLARAREAIEKLKLKNIITVQSNLDYFIGRFDLGIALHACGTSTDLMLQMCIRNRAHFVCCPCCYGGIKDCHQLVYPRSLTFSQLFQGVNKMQYFNLAHAADQTHENENMKTAQGFFCMDCIDTDRKMYAEENGYSVHFGKLEPVTCTNKNNLLVGLCKDLKE